MSFGQINSAQPPSPHNKNVPVRLCLFELISKEISKAEHKYINMHRPPIYAVVITILRLAYLNETRAEMVRAHAPPPLQ